MANHYRITVQPLKDGVPAEAAPLVFDADSHDDILAIIDRVQGKGLLPPDQVPAFITGLKLFGGIMLKNRTLPLFADVMGAFGGFMKALKAS